MPSHSGSGAQSPSPQPCSPKSRFTALRYRWRALSPATRLPILTVLFAELLLPIALWPIQGTEGNIYHAVHWVLGNARQDSWGPVAQGLAYFDGDQSRGLYQVTYFEAVDQLIFPPTSLLFFEPFRAIGGPGDGFLRAVNGFSQGVVLVTAILTGLIYVVSTRRFGGGQTTPGSAITRDSVLQFAAAAAGVLLFYPIVKAFTLGQAQTWLTCLFTAAVLAWLRGSRSLPGGLVGLICLIKPQLGVLVLWAAIRREWRFVIGWLAVVTVLGLVSVSVYGLGPHLDYLRLLEVLQARGESFYASHSVNGLMNRLLFNGPNLVWDPTHSQIRYIPLVHIITLLASAILLVPALFWRVTARVRPSIIEMFIASLSITMASPIAYEHHYGILAPIFAVFGAMMLGDRRTMRGEWVALAMAFVLSANFLSITQRLADSHFNVLQSYVLFAGLTVLVLLYRWEWRQSRSLTDAARSATAGTPSGRPFGTR